MFGTRGQWLLSVRINNSFIYLSNETLKEFVMIDSILDSVPVFRIKVIDKLNFIRDHLLLTTGAKVEIGLSSTGIDDDFTYYNFRVASFKSKELYPGTNQSLLTITGVLDIPGLFSPVISRAFFDKNSEIIKTIGKELSLLTLVEDTVKSNLNIQGQWSNYQFIRDLAKKSSNSSNIAGYLYFIDRNRQLYFVTMDYLYRQKSKQNFIYNTTIDKNIDDKSVIISGGMNDNIGILTYSGVGGVTAGGWDWETGQFVEQSAVIDDYEHFSLDLDLAVDKSLENNHNRYVYTGRNLELKQQIYEFLWRKLLVGTKYTIVVSGDLSNITLGTKIHITNQSSIDEYDIRGGDWIVLKKITFIMSKLVTKYVLYRDSVYDTKLVNRGLVKTKKRV